MYRAFRVRSATRRRTLLLAVVALLLQQMTLAVYACNLPTGAMAGMPTMTTMADDGLCPQVDARAEQALCLKHYAPDTLVAPTAHAPSVPPLPLPALPPDGPALMARMSTPAPPERVYPPPDSPPSAMLLFCTLLI
jgi:hypothetical protein